MTITVYLETGMNTRLTFCDVSNIHRISSWWSACTGAYEGEIVLSFSLVSVSGSMHRSTYQMTGEHVGGERAVAIRHSSRHPSAQGLHVLLFNANQHCAGEREDPRLVRPTPRAVPVVCIYPQTTVAKRRKTTCGHVLTHG